MAKETFRSYFGFRSPKHRRSHGSRSLKIVVVAAVLVVLAGIVLTLTHHSTGALPDSNTTTTTQAPQGTTGSSGSSGNSGNSGKTGTTGTTGNTGTSSTGSTIAKSKQTTTTTTPAAITQVSPSHILVQLFNGSGVSGQVGTAASQLAAIGFRINGTADAATFSYSKTVISYAPGQLAAAQTLQHYIGGATTLQESASVPSTEVQLITGTDFTGVTNS